MNDKHDIEFEDIHKTINEFYDIIYRDYDKIPLNIYETYIMIVDKLKNFVEIELLYLLEKNNTLEEENEILKEEIKELENKNE
jgi:hypothetical protein